MLTTCSTRPIRISSDVRQVQLNVDILGDRQHSNGGRTRMHPPLGFGFWHPLDPVHAALVFQPTVYTLLNANSDFLEATGGPSLALTNSIANPCLRSAVGTYGRGRRQKWPPHRHLFQHGIPSSRGGRPLRLWAITVFGLLRVQRKFRLDFRQFDFSQFLEIHVVSCGPFLRLIPIARQAVNWLKWSTIGPRRLYSRIKSRYRRWSAITSGSPTCFSTS